MAKRAPLRITHVRLQNWRNFRKAEAALGPRLFLIGPNASGKSNFLDAFRFLRDIVAVGGGFQEAVRRRGGVPSLRCLAARQPSEVGLLVRIGSDERPDAWEYELVFKEENRRPRVVRERVLREGQVLLERPGEDDYKDPLRLTQTHLEQVNVNRQFREVADFLGAIRYLHIVPQLVREPDRSVGRRNDPYGGDFLEQLASVPEKTRNARLKRILRILQVAVPQIKELELWRDVRGTPHLRGRYEHWRQAGWQTEDQFSDGTLRLLGLLWSLLDGTGPLLLEEPELSLHPEVVRHIASMVHRVQRDSGRQVIISTHSTDLLQNRGVGLDEVLMFVPGQEGTKVQSPADIEQVRRLVEGGLSLADAVIPYTRPKDAEQLSLLGLLGGSR